MKLTLENFSPRLLFHPFKTNTKKDLVIALIASIACGIFLIYGIYHVISRIRKVEKSESNTKAAMLPDFEVRIPPEVKKILDELFKGSPHSVDTLPVYPIIINKEQHPAPKRNKMTAPIMKGMADDGRAFLIMKLDCDLTVENIEKHCYSNDEKNFYKTHPQLKNVLILLQYRTTDELMWDQLDGGHLRPTFFTWNFTYAEDGSGPTDSQKENFKLVQTLLQTGSSKDTRGLIWRLSLTKKTASNPLLFSEILKKYLPSPISTFLS